MHLSQFLPDKALVLSKVAGLPANNDGQRTVRVQEAFKALAVLVKENAAYELHISLSDAAAAYEAVNGLHEDLPQGDEGQRARDEYESGMDDVVETTIEPYVALLSQNWLGINTIDSRIWEKDGPQRLATSAAKEMWRTISTERTPAQVLANAGIVATDFENIEVGAQSDAPFAQGNESMADTIEQVLMQVKTRIGTAYDRMAVYEDLQTIFDEEDETLVQSAASRLGIDMVGAGVLQIAALEFDDAPSELSDKLEKLNAGPKKAAPRAPRAPASNAAPLPPAEGQLDGSVLEALKTCGAGETTLAEALGVSRSTFVNYAKGKSAFTPDADQFDMLRKEVVNRANLMLAALATMDKTERTEVA